MNRTINPEITFEKYSKVFMANSQLEKKTLVSYESMLKKIIPAIGNMKVKDIAPSHVSEFLQSLGESGVCQKGDYAVSNKLKAITQQANISRNELARISKVSTTTTGDAIHGTKVNLVTAQKIAAALKRKTEDIFDIHTTSLPLSPKSIQNYKRLISSILTSAEKDNLVCINAATKTNFEINPKERSFLNIDEVILLRELLSRETDSPTKTLIMLGLHSNMNRSEIFGLSWDKIDFEKRMIIINQTLQCLPKEGLKLLPIKANNRIRIIHMTELLNEILLEHRQWWLEAKNKSGEWKGADFFLFVRENGTPMPPDMASKCILEFTRKHNFRQFTLEALRNTYNIIISYLDDDIETLKKFSGQSTEKILGSRYINKAKRNAIKKFDDYVLSLMKEK